MGDGDYSHEDFSQYCVLYLLLLLIVTILQYYTTYVWKLKYFPEVGVIMLVGMIFGACLFVIKILSNHFSLNSNHSPGQHYLGFDSNIFYFGFLPPIVFNSGYHLKRHYFYHNYDAILSLAIVGTTLSIVIITIGLWLIKTYRLCGSLLNSFTLFEFIAVSSLISSTDPVTILAVLSSLRIEPMLYYIIFGESILNDSIAITVFHSAVKYVNSDYISYEDLGNLLLQFVISFLGSCVLGYSLGICLAYIYGHINFQKNIIISISVFLIVVYMPFFLSEMLGLSGIVSILHAGIAARRYITKNISMHEKYTVSFLVQLLSQLSDTSCFALLGVSMFSITYSLITGTESAFNIFRFIFFMILLCWISRALHVYPLLTSVNLGRQYSSKERKSPMLISSRNMHVAWFSGLRGAVSFALANIFPDVHNNRNLVVLTTTSVILFTIFFQGGCTEPLLNLLHLPMNISSNYMNKPEREESSYFDFEKKYLYPFIVRPSKSQLLICTQSHSTPFQSPDKISVSVNSIASSGGGTLYDGHHDYGFDHSIENFSEESPSAGNRGLSPSAKKSINAMTPRRYISSSRISDSVSLPTALTSSPSDVPYKKGQLMQSCAGDDYGAWEYDGSKVGNVNIRQETPNFSVRETQVYRDIYSPAIKNDLI